MLEKIVSGGQTGVDRAGLDSAIYLEIPYGGWCPKGRIDELGTIPSKYNQLIEILCQVSSEKENYDTRTKLNIRDSDGTLILVPSMPLPSNIKDGTILTITEVSHQNKPYLVVNLSSLKEDNISKCMEWIRSNNIHTLNIAGPRESTCPGIYIESYSLLNSLLSRLIANSSLSKTNISSSEELKLGIQPSFISAFIMSDVTKLASLVLLVAGITALSLGICGLVASIAITTGVSIALIFGGSSIVAASSSVLAYSFFGYKLCIQENQKSQDNVDAFEGPEKNPEPTMNHTN